MFSPYGCFPVDKVDYFVTQASHKSTFFPTQGSFHSVKVTTTEKNDPMISKFTMGCHVFTINLANGIQWPGSISRPASLYLKLRIARKGTFPAEVEEHC